MKCRVQCKACPWRKDVKPDRDIPGGYCVKKHERLQETVADKDDVAGQVRSLASPLRLMACHESPGEESRRQSFVCVGWLDNQLGVGNNIALRLRALSDPSLQIKYKLVGEQHATLQDTIPKEKK